MIPQRETVGHFVTAGLALLAPASALAQEPAAPTSTAVPAAPRWRFQVSADGTWYEDPRFGVGDETGSWSTSGRASLALEQSYRRGSVSLRGYGGSIYYPEIESFNQATYGGSFGLSWAPSPRTQFRLGQTYDRSNTRQLRSLDPEALPLPTSALDTAATSVGLTQGLSRRWQLGLNGAYTWRRYDDPALVGGEQLYGSAELARQLGKSTTAYLSYGYSSSWFSGSQTRAHQALLGGRHQRKNVGFELGGGVGYLESVGQWYPAGNAGFTAAGRRTAFALRYTRDFGLAFGYGRQTIGDIASATLSYTAARRLSLTAGYYFGYRRDPAQTEYTILSHVASTGFSWGITKDLGLAAHYYWERNRTEGFEEVAAGRATASLSYGVSWK